MHFPDLFSVKYFTQDGNPDHQVRRSGFVASALQECLKPIASTANPDQNNTSQILFPRFVES
jgi:hypothetical protein